MQKVNESLRAKFTILLLIVGIIPLISASVFFYYTTKKALFNNVFKELEWNVEEVANQISGSFDVMRRDLIVASQNSAFKMYFLDFLDRPHWIKEQRKAIKLLRNLHKDKVDEICFIDTSGHELSRIVYNDFAADNELSSEEARQNFFQKALTLNEGQVYQGAPALSEDTNKWVIPNATPLVIDGTKVGILHFETNIKYFRDLLKSLINPDRGYAFIINEEGKVLAHTDKQMGISDPFPEAYSLVTDDSPGLKEIIKRMVEGKSGLDNFFKGKEDFYVIYRPIDLKSVEKGINDNHWSVGYVISGGQAYVEMAILKYNLLIIPIILGLVIVLAYFIGNYVTRPIRELSNVTDKLAIGEMPKLEVRSSDELGNLTASFNDMVDAIKERDDELKALAITDGLTGLFNHRHFKSEFEKAVHMATRFDHPLSLIMADVDHFKNYNDTNGHPQGDVVLKGVASIFAECSRDVDLPARYGGEEFVLILPETDIKGATIIAERIRKGVESESFPNEVAQPGGNLTLSLGVASLSDGARDAATILDRADKALYKAKLRDRNCVVVFD